MTNLNQLKKSVFLSIILLCPILLNSCEDDEEQLLEISQRISAIWIVQNYIVEGKTSAGLGAQLYFKPCSNLSQCSGSYWGVSTSADFLYQLKDENTILNIEYDDVEEHKKFEGDWTIERFTNNDLKLTRISSVGTDEISLTTSFKQN
ncbi:hypothetical protein [Fulvivirga sp.]|uniref:hypothetical protein n=1 Tax=Fulvivirga sp. TaxID=1931237 RepID=UPI0032ED5F6F